MTQENFNIILKIMFMRGLIKGLETAENGIKKAKIEAQQQCDVDIEDEAYKWAEEHDMLDCFGGVD